MADAWETLIANSTLGSGDAWEHLNNQSGGGGGVGGVEVNGIAFGGGAGNDPDAIHDNVAAEISAITEKTDPVAADLVLIEDSADTHNKKRGQLGNVYVDSGYF